MPQFAASPPARGPIPWFVLGLCAASATVLITQEPDLEPAKLLLAEAAETVSAIENTEKALHPAQVILEQYLRCDDPENGLPFAASNPRCRYIVLQGAARFGKTYANARQYEKAMDVVRLTSPRMRLGFFSDVFNEFSAQELSEEDSANRRYVGMALIDAWIGWLPNWNMVLKNQQSGISPGLASGSMPHLNRRLTPPSADPAWNRFAG